jgi:FolB domain-containing protein
MPLYRPYLFMNAGVITIHGLDLPTYIGVPEQERAQLQVLRAFISVVPQHSFHEMQDDVQYTSDYAQLALRCQQLALAKPRRLLETLADELAELALREFAAKKVQIELQKKILPGVEYVSVRLEKTK